MLGSLFLLLEWVVLVQVLLRDPYIDHCRWWCSGVHMCAEELHMVTRRWMLVL